MIKRIFDIFFSVIFLASSAPFILVLGILVVFDSKGSMFIFQERIGKNQKPFQLVKLRTMLANSQNKGLLTIGNRDQRVTRVGYFLRKYKLDEFPQFWNVLKGDMSIVGPRPEVKKYVDLYDSNQKEIFRFRPGITDVSSILFWNESELLAKATDPERHYIDVRRCNAFQDRLLLPIIRFRSKKVCWKHRLFLVGNGRFPFDWNHTNQRTFLLPVAAQRCSCRLSEHSKIEEIHPICTSAKNTQHGLPVDPDFQW